MSYEALCPECEGPLTLQDPMAGEVEYRWSGQVLEPVVREADPGEQRLPAVAQTGDPNVIWIIGRTDNSADEFARGTARSLVYDVTAGATSKDWREKQDAPDQPYTIRFSLPKAPSSAPTLVVDGFFMEANPKSAPLDAVDRGKFFSGLCHFSNRAKSAPVGQASRHNLHFPQ